MDSTPAQVHEVTLDPCEFKLGDETIPYVVFPVHSRIHLPDDALEIRVSDLRTQVEQREAEFVWLKI